MKKISKKYYNSELTTLNSWRLAAPRHSCGRIQQHAMLFLAYSAYLPGPADRLLHNAKGRVPTQASTLFWMNQSLQEGGREMSSHSKEEIGATLLPVDK